MEYWDEVRTATRMAKGIAFDGCHKIYVLMDNEQVELMRSYGYGKDDDYLYTSADKTNDEMYDLVEKWFAESCGLRFINAVSSVGEGEDENDGFIDLIPQGAFDDEECEDCGYAGCDGGCSDPSMNDVDGDDE